MLYDDIIIDSANLFYRLQNNDNSTTTVIELTKKMINFVNDETKKHLKENGTIWIVFDPISKNKLNEEKSFHIQTYSKSTSSIRKNINKNYKAKRQYSPFYAKTIENVMKYFAYRGEKIKEVYSQTYEADDYIEPLVASLPKDSQIALVTTDEDWAKAIKENVYMINKGYDEPWSKKDFFEKYKFNPTPAANILYKSFFGDKSDNIQGCIFMKKAKFMTNIRKTCLNVIKDVSESGISIDDFMHNFEHISYLDIINKENKTNTELLFLEFTIASQKEGVLAKMKQNVHLVRSLLDGKDISKYIHWNPENEKFNDIIRQSIYGLDGKTWFGKVSV